MTFGSEPGADVAIEAGPDGALAASALPSFTTVATADDVGGTHTFRITRPARDRYLLIWFTKLPPSGPGRYQAQISNVVVRGRRQPMPVRHDFPPDSTVKYFRHVP